MTRLVEAVAKAGAARHEGSQVGSSIAPAMPQAINKLYVP